MRQFLRDLRCIIRDTFVKDKECPRCGRMVHPDRLGTAGVCVDCFLRSVLCRKRN